jgi:hypothetical protein
MIKLRMDVDYPYPSRYRSFLAITLNLKPGKDYLKNSKILANMINESPMDLMAYWFFTPYTKPDAELLALLHPDRHEVALHVARDPYPELERLEKATNRKVKYYTVHGTARVVARLMWKRKINQRVVPVPKSFPLIFFYDVPTLNFDWVCYHHPTYQVLKIAAASIAKGEILHVHPEWLFQRGTLNHRGPYYEALRIVLETDKDIRSLVVLKKRFVKVATFWGANDYMHDHAPTEALMKKLSYRDADIYSFAERRWCCPVPNPPKTWKKTQETLALLKVNSYNEWFEKIGKKTRNMIRKAEKSGIITTVAVPDKKFAEGIWKIYNETPIRQGRSFPHYGTPLEQLKTEISPAEDITFIGAYLQDELVGFIMLTQGDNTAAISQILSLQKYWDKAVNNALVAKAIEVCAEKKVQWVMYGRMGNHPTLDNFKESNNFTKYPITRYYVPLTRKGRIAIRLNLQRDLKDTLPMWIKKPLFPVFSWVSRTKMKVRLIRRST